MTNKMTNKITKKITKKRTLSLISQGFTTVWSNGPKGSKEIEVDVYFEDKLVLEWVFHKLSGNALNGNAAIYLEQVLVYAKVEVEKEKNRASLVG